jgi:hypothetical protein
MVHAVMNASSTPAPFSPSDGREPDVSPSSVAEFSALALDPRYVEMLRDIVRRLAEVMQQPPQEKSVWTATKATPTLTGVELRYDAWVAQSRIPGHPVQATFGFVISPGEVRIGVILPETAVSVEGSDLRGAFAGILGKHKADVVVTRPGNALLVDWHFTEEVFSAQWLHAALSDPSRQSMILHRLFFLAMTIWRGVTEIIATVGRLALAHDLLITSEKEIPSLLLSRDLGGMVFDSLFDQSTGRYLTVVRADMDAGALQDALRQAGIDAEVQVMTRVDVAPPSEPA